jgi:hypothetical protein
MTKKKIAPEDNRITAYIRKREEVFAAEAKERFCGSLINHETNEQPELPLDRSRPQPADGH